MSNTVSVEEMEAIAVGEPALQKALKMEKVFLTKTQERMIYENRQKAIQTYDATMEGRWEDGKSFGLHEGKTLGLLEGESKAKIAIAKYLLQKGLSLQEISAITELSLSELEKL